MGDLPDYTSPVDDRVVHGRKGRREDLKRSGCRPYEGRASEAKEAERQKGYIEKAQDHRIEEAARHAYAQLSPDKKRILLRG